MRLALLSWQKGYYQRMVLDTTMRNQLRVLGDEPRPAERRHEPEHAYTVARPPEVDKTLTLNIG